MEIGHIFGGSALGTVDPKGRTSLPADFRAVVEARLAAGYQPGTSLPDKAVLLGEHPRLPCLQGYDQSYQAVLFNRLREKAELAGGDFAEVFEDLQFEHFGAVEKVGYDPSGRIVLPGVLREAAGLTDGVAFFIGGGETFQIWNPDRFREANADKPRLIRMLDAQLRERRK